jgi:protein SCO1/2
MTTSTTTHGAAILRRQTDRRTPRTRAVIVPALVVVCALAASNAFGQSLPALASVPPPGPAAQQQIPLLKNVGIDQKLDSQVPMDLTFVDENGRDVKLGSLFDGKPVVLALVYYQCPMLCTEVLNGIAGSLATMKFNAGKEFNVIVVSFDPSDTPAQAIEKKQGFLTRYRRADDERGIHFLTGRHDEIAALTGAVGFKYVWDPEISQFAHPAAITVLTPQGRISRYLYGIEFSPRDLELALVEASAGKIGTAVDQALLFCYHYDPETGRYGVAIMNLIRAGGLLTLAAMGLFIGWNVRRERRGANAVATTATGTR